MSFRISRKAVLVSVAVLPLLLSVFAAAPEAAGKDRPLLRFPDIHGDLVVFVSGEDIWTAPATGGTATRITIHDGEERYPKFSPDGKLIAFTGEYDGNEDVYVMNTHGGDITRVTWHPAVDEVVGWNPVNGKIIFRSARNSWSRFSRLFMVNPDGSGLEELIMHEAVQGSFSPDGKKIAYNRVSRENRTWKRYRGGTAQDIYVFDFEKNKDTKITDFEGTDRIPMWIGDRIYFSSDRDRRLNIWYYDTGTGKTVQVTHHADFDVRRPSSGGDRIVYEKGGDIWMLDTKSGETSMIPIEVASDAPELRERYESVADLITGVDVSPTGKRALVSARGEVFTVPYEHGATRNLTGSSGSREKDAVWSPDGKKIAYFSDASGEYQIWLQEPGTGKEPVKLTDLAPGYRHTLRWSPDSRKLAYADQTLRCWWIDVDSGSRHEIDRAEYENIDVSLDLKPINDFQWSPDSRWIAYSKMNADQVYQVYIYSLDSGKTHRVSNGIFNDFGPVFTDDGEHLLFISNRRFDPTFGDFEWEMVYKDAAGIYSLTLRRDGPPLFPPQSDEAVVEEKDNGEKESAETVVKIDFDGIGDRIEHFPLPRGNYRELAESGGNVFYLNKDKGDFNHFEFRSHMPMDLYRFSTGDREQKKVISSIDGYALSSDGKKIVYMGRGRVGIIASTDTDSGGNDLDLSDLRIKLDPLAEWHQIFREAWRMERDFYYEPNMHGLDWKAIGKKYGALMDRVTCRQDVRFVIGELIGELNTSHTYVFGGDIARRAQYVSTGMLGVDWKTDEKAGRYMFGKIYRVPDWTREIVPPLEGPGIHVEEGDYLLKVDGVDVTTDRNIYSYFQNLAGKQVMIEVGSDPSGKDSREYTVTPTAYEFTLRYLDWVEHNRKVADKESGGTIGYLHLPDTYLGSAREFPKYFYSQTRKKGIIVDGRFNGGGLDPAIFLQRLGKKVFAFWTRRYSHDQTSPAVATRAHLVCLTNRQAGSGGDMLPMEFQMMKLGPVIGTRTWGGLVGVSMWIGLVDGGGLSAPDYRIYDTDGKWIVENKGVVPDIEVDLDPVEMSNGYDAQLMKAIEVLKKQIKEDPRPWPEHEPFQVDR